MALGNKNRKEQTSDKPAFEDEGGNTTVAEGAAQQETSNETVTPEVKERATEVVVQAAATSNQVATREAAESAKAFQKELDGMRGDSDFSYGNYRQFKAVQGAIQESGGDKDDLGRWIKVRLMSWDNHFEVSPGEDGPASKDFVAYSKDGKVIDQVIGEEHKAWIGKDVTEYLAYLKDEEDFDKAKVREFIDCGCALLGSESGDGPVGTVIQVTLSESSMMAFNKYQNGLKDTARAAAMGIPGFKVPVDPFTFYFVVEKAEKGSMKWTKFKICQELPAKL